MHKVTGAKFNQSFQADEVTMRVIEENLVLGKYRDKSKMFRDALVSQNEILKTTHGVTA